jgi:alpha-1,3-rhamnosyl/mannosyltransferase
MVGTVEPRKNISLAIRATRELRARGHDVQLVLVGSRGWARKSEIEEILAAQAEGIVVWPGYVSDDERDALYAGASALLLPSMYEGFGMPLIEAMTAGLPCVCSAIPVFDEVAGGAALRADPNNPIEWADRLEKLIGQPDLAQKLRTAGLNQAASFSKERTARAFRVAVAQGL